jgi:PAS domain S-box-containing protein
LTSKGVAEICLIAPSQVLASKAQKIISDRNEHIEVFVAALDEAKELSKELMQKGAKIIISRKGTKTLLENELAIPIVGINTMTSDYIEAFKLAKDANGLVAFFSYEDITEDVKTLGYLLNIHLKNYKFSSDIDSGYCVKNAIAEGAVLGIGGTVSEKYSKLYNLEHIVIENSEESISVAIESAKQILEVKKREEEKQEALKIKLERYESIFNYTHDAIIAINEKGAVDVLNKEAEKIIRSELKPYVGKNIDEILPETKMLEVLDSGEKKLDCLMKINDTYVSTNRIPINVNGKVKGVVATFQDVKRIQHSEKKIRIKMHEKGLVAKYHFSDIIGSSPKIKNVIDIAKSYAKSDSTVLICGQSGTGKELFANSIHNYSLRENSPFVAINCASIPKNLLEAELFGYEEGAFTGATKGGKAGVFELAHTGTIFLDEIGEIPMETQVKLLRVLQEKEIRRIGGDSVTPVDIRVITATNRNLEKEVREGRFREDLYYRINILNVEIPSLCERKEDVLEIGKNIFKKLIGIKYHYYEDFFINIMDLIRDYNWPGNVRELHNFVERISVLLMNHEDEEKIKRNVVDKLQVSSTDDQFGDSNDLDMWERAKIINTLKRNNLVIAKTSRELGFSRSTLYRKMKQYNIKI